MKVIRRVAKAAARGRKEASSGVPGTLADNEMDTLADTSCAGPNWRLLERTGVECDVGGFKDDEPFQLLHAQLLLCFKTLDKKSFSLDMKCCTLVMH